MTDSFSAAVEQINDLFPDTRTEYCRLVVASPDEGAVVITGEVLDEHALERVRRDLGVRLPDTNVDLSGVRVLRAGATSAALGANITGLYAQPSFLAEQISQLLNAAPLEILKEDGRWRFVRQTDGYLGWVFAPYLTGALELHLHAPGERAPSAGPARAERVRGD